MGISLWSLVVGLIWLILWVGRFFIIHIPRHAYLEGALEFMITTPLGFAFIYDWLVFKRKKRPGFLEQDHWNFADYLFFITGVSGFFTLLIYSIIGGSTIEHKTMGVIGIAIGIIHWTRRRIRMQG